MSGSRTRRGSVPGDVSHTLEGEPELATENPLDGVALLLQQALGPVLASLSTSRTLRKRDSHGRPEYSSEIGVMSSDPIPR